MFQIELAIKNLYKTRIGRISLKLLELPELNKKTRKIKVSKKSLDNYKKINGMLYHQR